MDKANALGDYLRARRDLVRPEDIGLIPGTSSLGHLRENIAAAGLVLSDDVVKELDGIGG
jgi:aryl-alcohol dehydrogenase-like predicted oxidoreductase